ncbi:MAG: methyl-accepting chemotaxis sensory transducer [Armatimonadetes bacterium]|jgi:methyl-accepting chemotaxis protein|nr:methyl-accepting chemotaxis sensory transducer [Armatimonadota bacterium]
MTFLKHSKVGTRLLLLVAAFILGLLTYAGFAYSTREMVQIDGPLYHEIMRSQELLGDVMPSELYLGEAYLVAHELANETNPGRLDGLLRKSRLLRQKYEESQEAWRERPLDPALKKALLGKSYEPAQRFFTLRDGKFIPAVRARNRPRALELLNGPLKQAFGEHREGVDEVVRLAEAAGAGKLRDTRETIRSRTFQQIALAGAIIVILGFGLGFLVTRSITNTLHETAGTLSSTSIELASTMEQQERTALSQSAAVNETTTTMDELDASFMQTGEMVKTAADRAEQSLAVATRGIRTVQQTLDGMLGLKEKVGTIAEQIVTLSEQTSQISTITGQVTALANQTNMLALNAAVEAARAGDHGRGFAVVAAEIRKLADGSGRSAERIDALVHQIQKATNATVMATEEGTKTVELGIRLAQRTVEAFDEVKEASNTASEAAQQMLLSVPQQVTAVKQVLASMDSLNTGARETAAGIGQTRIGSENLREAALKLKAMI